MKRKAKPKSDKSVEEESSLLHTVPILKELFKKAPPLTCQEKDAVQYVYINHPSVLTSTYHALINYAKAPIKALFDSNNYDFITKSRTTLILEIPYIACNKEAKNGAPEFLNALIKSYDVIIIGTKINLDRITLLKKLVNSTNLVQYISQRFATQHIKQVEVNKLSKCKMVLLDHEITVDTNFIGNEVIFPMAEKNTNAFYEEILKYLKYIETNGNHLTTALWKMLT